MKKLAIIAIVPLMFLALNGCTDTEQEEQAQPEDTTTEETTPETTQPEEADTGEEAPGGDTNNELPELFSEIQIYEEVVENSDTITLEQCSSFKDDRLHTQCEAKVQLNLAVADLDASLCDSITLEKEKEDCKTYVQDKIVEQEFLNSQ